MTKFTVIGAGMAGLLAGCMLRSNCSGVLEKQEQLPNNHSAVLRFRSSVVGDTLNIPFKRVQALKAIKPWRNPVADAMAYSRKTNGEYTLRSIVSANGAMSERYIAPSDLISRMAEILGGKLAYGISVGAKEITSGITSVISTLPMPVLAQMLGYRELDPEDFKWMPGININMRIQGMNSYASLYVPDPSDTYARLSLTGDQFTIEIPCDSKRDQDSNMDALRNQQFRDHLIQKALADVGIGLRPPSRLIKEIVVKPQAYAKILPINENARKRFILWATEQHGIFSLGRFATWRPGLMLDDLVDDVRAIQMIAQHGNYNYRL